MRILLAPDSFKEAASAEAIAQAMARGIKRGNPQAECRLMPLSDGGEGLTQALVHVIPSCPMKYCWRFRFVMSTTSKSMR